jgi:LPXTG-site transpeptidase (sortase) family protein
MVMGRYLAGGARLRPAPRPQRHRARGRERPGAGFRTWSCRAHAGAGEPGTAIYSGHRDTHFVFLGDVTVGDEVRVTGRDGREFRFRVTGTSVVRWDASGIDPHADGRWLALVTCWPLDGTFSGPLRYVVRAELMENLSGRPRASDLGFTRDRHF